MTVLKKARVELKQAINRDQSEISDIQHGRQKFRKLRSHVKCLFFCSYPYNRNMFALVFQSGFEQLPSRSKTIRLRTHSDVEMKTRRGLQRDGGMRGSIPSRSSFSWLAHVCLVQALCRGPRCSRLVSSPCTEPWHHAHKGNTTQAHAGSDCASKYPPPPPFPVWGANTQLVLNFHFSPYKYIYFFPAQASRQHWYGVMIP